MEAFNSLLLFLLFLLFYYVLDLDPNVDLRILKCSFIPNSRSKLPEEIKECARSVFMKNKLSRAVSTAASPQSFK